MVHRNNPRVFCSPGKEDIAAGSQNQQHATPRLTRSRRRKHRQTTSEWQGEDQPRSLQVYRFRSRAPSTSAYYNGEGSLGFSRIPALTEDRKIVEMLARSASYWMHQEPARCWVRDCTGLACSGAGHPLRRCRFQHHLLSEEDSLTSLIRDELFSMDEGNHDDVRDTGTMSSQVNVTNNNAPRSFAEEYSLAPLNTQKKYSAQNFDQQVENYFKRP